MAICTRVFERLHNESVPHFLWRLGQLKDNDPSISWGDVALSMNRECYGDDVNSYKGTDSYRKLYQSAKIFYDDGVFENEVDDKHIENLKNLKDELFKERKKLSDQRREYNKQLTEDARAEHLFEELTSIADKMNYEKPLEYRPTIFPENRTKEALLILNDWHYGMVTDNVWNKYNVEICKERVKTLIEYTKEYLRNNNISVLHIAMLGDAAHGGIHVSCRVQSEEDVCDQIMHVSELLAETVNELSETVNKVNVYSCYGNHLRTIQKKDDSIHSDNMEKLIPWWMKQRLANNPKVSIITSNYYEFIRLNILGSEICCVHGDLDDFRSLGVTMNTLFNKVYGDTIDYTISADKHHLQEFENFGIESILVGALCGTDDYASNRRLYSDPRQTLMIFNDVYGRECTYNIPLL